MPNKFANKLREILAIAPFSSVASQLPALSKVYLAELIYESINDEKQLLGIAQSSYRHQNDYDKFILYTDENGWSLRIHIWDKAIAKKANSELNIHNHTWEYASLILCGSIYEHVYASAESGEEYLLYKCLSDPLLGRSTYVCQGQSHLESKTVNLYRAGESYYNDSALVHQIISGSDYTATFVVQNLHLNSTSEIYSKESIDFKNKGSKRTTLTAEEVFQKISNLLCHI